MNLAFAGMFSLTGHVKYIIPWAMDESERISKNFIVLTFSV